MDRKKYIGYFEEGEYKIVSVDPKDYDKIAYYRTNYVAFEFDDINEAKKFLSQLEITPRRYFKNNIICTELYVSDIHLPYEDHLAMEAFFNIAKLINPNVVFLGGDILDSYAVSDWIKNQELSNIVHEVDATKLFLLKLKKLFPNATFFYQEGNHEARLQKAILRAGDLMPLAIRYTNIQSLLKLSQIGVKYIRGVFLDPIIYKLYHIHGHEKKMSGQVQHVALNILRWLNKNVIAGHFHKFDSFYITEVDKTLKASWINGCLFDVDLLPTPYAVDTSQRGFSIVRYYSNRLFSVEQVIFTPIVKSGRLKYSVVFENVNYVF